jgi:tetratricopeptide (TPR) repeat protein
MINIYITSGKPDDAMKYLDLAIKQDPENPSYYFAQGKLLDDIGRKDEAIKSYETAIEKNPDYFDAHYNLGALYYNEGVKQMDIARAVPPNENAKYEEELAKCDNWWLKALPYMEKCYKLNNKDISTIESLKNLYYRMIPKDREKWESKYKEMDSLLKNL